jgi:predicted dehydrogenase
MSSDHSPAPVAVGLIGLGEIGQVHAAAIQGSRTARLVAVADTAAELLTPFEARGVRGYREAGELIASLRLAGLESLSVGYRSGPALSMFRDRQWREVPVPPDDWSATVQASVTAYLDAVSAGREPPVTGATALESVSLLERIYDTATVLPSPGLG